MSMDNEKAEDLGSISSEETEETKKREELEAEEIEETKEACNAEELTRQKKAANEFWAKNNLGQTQVFINSLNGNFSVGARKSAEKLDKKLSAKKYDLKDRKDCIEFVETCRGSEYLAVALILCAFEVVALTDLPELKNKILTYLPVTAKDEEEKKAGFAREDPYLSVDTLLCVIGGFCFTTETGQICVTLGEDSVRVLANIREQFPVLWDSLIRWLLKLTDNHTYHTAFEAYQMAAAFARVISLDFTNAEKKIFPSMYANPGNEELLGTLLYLLYRDTKHRQKAEDILWKWIQSDGKWFWKSTCLTCLLLLENGCEWPYKEELKQLIWKKMPSFQWKDWSFVVELLFSSPYYRTLFAEILRDACASEHNREKQWFWSEIYVRLLRRCYYKVSDTRSALPLVACDTKAQQFCISPIICTVMRRYPLRKQLYIILEAYLEEIAFYSCSEIMLNHVTAFFFNMSSSASEYHLDILAFLKRCHGRVAKQIYRSLAGIKEEKRRLCTHERI